MKSRYNAFGFVAAAFAMGVILYLVIASPRGGGPADTSTSVTRDGTGN